MNTLGVILARAGSKGLASKHLRPLLGRPLIEYSFDASLQAKSLSYVVCSSDCETIRALATQRGIMTINRPEALATDDASVQDVLLHALDQFESKSEQKIDAVVTIYGNVPVRPAGLIDSAIELLANTRCDCVRSFCPVGKWHPAWMSRLDGDRVLPMTGHGVHRRQDLEPMFLHDGGVVVSSRRAMDFAREHRSDPHAFFGTDRRAVLTRQGDVIEVDSLRDLLLAEAALREIGAAA